MGSAVSPAFTIEPPDQSFTIEPPTVKNYLPGRAFGQNVASGMGLDADKIKAAEDSGGHSEALKEMGRQVYEGLHGFVLNVAQDPAHLADPINSMASGLANALGVPDKGSMFDANGYHRPSVGKVVGAASSILGGIEGAKATGRTIAAAPSAIPAVADVASRALRDETGNLRPSIQKGAATVGAVTGAAPGVMHGNIESAVIGGAAGAHYLPKAIDALAPTREPTVAKAVPLSQGPTYPALQAARRLAMKEASQRLAQSTDQSVSPQSPSTPTQSSVVSSSSPASIEPEGRPATWSNQSVLARAAQGDMTAIQQARLRSLPLPENASFVGNKAATLEPTVGSRKGDIVHFDSEGNPLSAPGPAAPKLAGGPASFNKLSLSDGEDLGPGMGTDHIIRDRNGNRVGSVQVEPKADGVIHVHWLGGEFGASARGPIMDAIKEQYPGTKRITYDRRRLAKGAASATTEPREMSISGSQE